MRLFLLLLAELAKREKSLLHANAQWACPGYQEMVKMKCNGEICINRVIANAIVMPLWPADNNL